MQVKKTLFIFRRDLRVIDNTGLIEASKESKEVVPCFIFTPEQIEKNPYRGDMCLGFMLESLEELSEEITRLGGKLQIFYGAPEKIVADCIEELQIDQVVVNRDYTPYSTKRDALIKNACKKKNTIFKSYDDVLIQPVEETLKKDGKPYMVFTPFYKNSSQIEVRKPAKDQIDNFSSEKISFAKTPAFFDQILAERGGKCFKGGRSKGLQILKNLKDFKRYATDRDFPEKSTTHLSAYLKFTVISPREVYYAAEKALGESHDLIRELYWRDFFSQIAFFFPHVFKGAFHKKYDALEWTGTEKDFERWCNGETGFPIVDAGMRELNETGYMHNRVRMIVASFLTKDLHLDWHLGEKYFAKKLVDYDPAVNNGNWQWVAGTGCDAQPYFRIFNPFSQQKKFDPDCHYIRKWLPELKNVDTKSIHQGINPMLDHAKEAKIALKLYKSVQ